MTHAGLPFNGSPFLNDGEKQMQRLPAPLMTLFLALFALSCATGSGAVRPDETVVEDPLPKPSLYHEAPDLPWIWNCLPRDNAPVYFSTSGLRKNREDEKVWALQSAAIQAAHFDHISGNREFLIQSSSISFGRMENAEVFFNHETARQFYDQVEVIEEFSDREGTYLLSRVPSQQARIPYTITYTDGKPSWISNMPTIPGYRVAVGSVRMHRTLTDSLAAADRAAFLEMLNIIFGQVNAQREEIVQAGESGTSSAQITTTRITAEGEMKGFLIIARWRDERHNYYSLAVCPEEQ